MIDALVGPLVSMVLRQTAVRALIGRLVAYLIVAVLFAIAFGFLVATLYLALITAMEPPLAALLTSLCLGIVACLILLTMRLRRPPRRAATGTASPEALLLSMTDQVRRDPWSSMAVAAILGALAEITRPGSSPPR